DAAREPYPGARCPAASGAAGLVPCRAAVAGGTAAARAPALPAGANRGGGAAAGRAARPVLLAPNRPPGPPRRRPGADCPGMVARRPGSSGGGTDARLLLPRGHGGPALLDLSGRPVSARGADPAGLVPPRGLRLNRGRRRTARPQRSGPGRPAPG